MSLLASIHWCKPCADIIVLTFLAEKYINLKTIKNYENTKNIGSIVPQRATL